MFADVLLFSQGATHILLVDPVAGASERARAIEAQAIGRAHRLGQEGVLTVVRFLMRGTVEEDMYFQNYSKYTHAEHAPTAEEKEKGPDEG